VILTNNFAVLLKFQLKYKLGLRRWKEAIGASKYGKAAALGGTLLLLFLVGCILVPYIIIMDVLYDSFAANGNPAGYFDTLFLLSNFVTFVTALLSTYSILFSGRDREILTPLPIKKQYIFLTNYITLYAGALIASLGFILPGFIIYEIKTGFSFLILIKAFIGSVAFPALPLAIAFLMMSLLLAVASGFRHKELLATLFGVIILGGFVFLNSNQELLLKFVENSADSVSKFSKIFVNAFFLRESILQKGGSSWGYLLLVVAAAAIFIFLIYLYGSAVYDKILQRMSASVASKEKKKQKYKEGKPSAAFFRKEMKTILRSPVYALNCLLNIILAPIAAILISREASFRLLLDKLAQNPEHIDFLLAMFGLLIGLGLMSLNMVPSTSISREGKCIWISEIIPVRLKSQIKGRIAAAVLFYIMSGALFIILFGILLKINLLYIIYGFFIILAGAVPFAYGGLFIDLSHPKLIWDKESEAVKQNFNGMLGMFLSIVMTLIYMVPFFLYLAGIFTEAAVLAAIPILVLLMILLNVSLLNKKIKILER
jgi:putative membrane protein